MEWLLFRTSRIAPEILSGLFFEPAPSVDSAIAASLAEYGPAAKIAVIPKEPYVLAQVT